MKDHQMISLFKYSLCVICVVWDGIQVGRVGVLGFTLMKRVFMLPILLIRRTSAAIVFLACLASASVSVAQVPDWPDLYDPFERYPRGFRYEIEHSNVTEEKSGPSGDLESQRPSSTADASANLESSLHDLNWAEDPELSARIQRLTQ